MMRGRGVRHEKLKRDFGAAAAEKRLNSNSNNFFRPRGDDRGKGTSVCQRFSKVPLIHTLTLTHTAVARGRESGAES